MQQISLDHDVYKWLQSLGVINSTQQVKSNGKLTLDANLSRLFMNGCKFGELVHKIQQERQRDGETPNVVNNIQQQNSMPSADALKDGSTPGIRLYNWNLVNDMFQRIGFPFDQDIKALLVQGDNEMVNEVLKDVMENENQREERNSRGSNTQSKKLDQEQQPSKPPITPIKSSDSNQVNLNQVDPQRPLKDTQTLLEFFLTGISKHMQLKPKQSAALLSNGNKYLAHVMVKGAKNDFDPVIGWLSEVYANLDRVLQFMTQNEMNISIFFSTIKPGLLSKEPEVSLWSLRTQSKVLFELSNLELHPPAYEWFTKEQGGLSACMLCVRRHPQLLQQVCDVLAQISRFNTNDLFSVQFRKILDSGLEYIEIINLLLEPLCQSKQMKDELLGAGLVDYWCELAVKHADSQSPELRIAGIKYLTLMWLQYPLQFEDNQNLATQVLFLAKRATRQSNQVLKYVTLQCMFRLLDSFAKERNPFAAVVYKKLTFSLIENFQELETRQFMEANFCEIFKKYSTIPIEILFEPFAKNCQVNETTTQLNLSDYGMLRIGTAHPRMSLKLAITTTDLLAQTYLNDPVFGSVSLQLIQALTSRYIENEPMQEFVFKLSKVGLASYYAGAKSRQEAPRVADHTLQAQLTAQTQEANIRGAQKRAQVVELLKHFLGLECANMNEQLRPLVVHFYLEIKNNLKREDKGMLSLLLLLGNPQEIVKQIQDQWSEDKAFQEFELEKVQITQEYENEFTDSPKRKITSDDPFMELRNDEATQERLFLEQNNVGLKQDKEKDKDRDIKIEDKPKDSKKNSKTTKTNNSKPRDVQSSTRIPQNKVDLKVMDSLAQIRLKKDSDEAQRKQEQEDKVKREQLLQRRAQQEIIRRNQQGGMKETKDGGGEIDEDENTQNINVIGLVNLEEEENRESESVNISLRTHSKAFKYLWSRYSNTTNQAQKKQLFGELQEQFDQIQVSDVWRFCKDYGLNENISRGELTLLIRTLNQRVSRRGGDLNTLDYEGFLILITQLALHIYSQPVHDLRTLPAGASVDQLVRELAMAAKRRGENSVIFEDPDNLKMDPDREILRELNWQLRTDPDIEIPNKFRKVTERELKYNYDYRPNVIPKLQAWFDCHSILSSIIDDNFNVNIVEPISEVKIMTKARRKNIEPRNAEQKKQQNSEQDAPNSVALSKRSKLPNRSVESEAEQGSIRSGALRDISQRRKPQIVNKALEEKQRQQEEEDVRRQIQEEKFRKHQESVKQNFNKMKNERERLEVDKKEDERTRLIAENEKDKSQSEKQRREAEERKKKLQEYKEKMQEDKKAKEVTDVEEKKLIEETKRKEREQFMKNQQKEIQRMIEEKKKEFKEKENKEKQKEKQQQEEEKEWKKSVKVMLKEEGEYRAGEKQAEAKILQMPKQKEYQEIFKRNEKSIQALYNSYQEYSDWRIDNTESEKDLLQNKGFTNFLSQFNFTPAVLAPEQGQLIFHTIAREREKNYQQGASGVNPPTHGMSLDEFNQALLRLSIKGQKYFDLIHEKYNKDMKIIQMMDIVKEEKRQQDQSVGTQKKNKISEDMYQNIDATTPKTLEGLFLYMDLPAERSELQSKLRALKLEQQKVAPRDKKRAIEKVGGDQDKSPQPLARNKSAKRNPSASRKVIIAPVKEERNRNQGIVGPGGKKENWQVQN